MKPLVAFVGTLVLQNLLTGCVVFPHGEWVAPPASGRVLDSHDLQPVAHVRVSRRIESLERTRVTATDERGAFTFRKDMDLRWLPFVCYAAHAIEYRVEAAGFQPYMTNLYGGGSFYHGRHPHDLGDIVMERIQK